MPGPTRTRCCDLPPTASTRRSKASTGLSRAATRSPRPSSAPCRRGGCSSARKASAFSSEDPSDRLIDAATGQPVAGSAPADLAPVRLNNRLRGIVQAALGSLTLMAPDPAKRLEAAQAVFKSRDANALPALDQAIAKETDARVKQALDRGARGGRALSRQCIRSRQDRSHRRHPPARRSGGARPALAACRRAPRPP